MHADMYSSAALRPPNNPCQGYTWDPSCISENESLWSVLHKFAAINICTASDIQKVFGYDNDQRLLNSWTTRNQDLRTGGALDLKKVGRILELSESVLGTATLTSYFDEPRMHNYTSAQLRVCWVCLQEGFHSVLFQLLPLKQCLEHGVALTKSCPL